MTAIVGVLVLGIALVLLFAEPVLVAATDLPADTRTGINAWSLVAATIIFTYDGWIFASYFSGEVKGGAGAVARGCIKGTAIVIALYLLLNVAMIKSVSLPAFAGSDLAISRALEIAVSPFAGAAVVIIAIIILLSHQNQGYMGAPRVLQALATDGLAMHKAGEVARRGNPMFAVLLTWSLSVALILMGGFEFLLTLCVFFFVPLYVAIIIGVLILRKREPDTERPYRAWGHPYSTFICLFGWTVITIFQAYAERETALYAVVMIAVSIPVYRYLNRNRGSSDT